jgi:prophage regulatory protein
MSFSLLADYQHKHGKSLARTGTSVYNVKVNRAKEKSKLPDCIYFVELLQMNYENKLLSIKQVCDLTSVSRSTIYRKVDDGSFPPPVRLGANMVRWLLTDVVKWIQGLK